jgi:predicted nucleic acid-binding protein
LGRPKFGIPASLLARWFAFLDTATTQVIIDQPIEFPRDQKDAVFIACAIAARADYLITGDRDFTEARKLLTTAIVSVSQFQRLVCAEMP